MKSRSGTVSAQRPEASANFFREQLWLLPGREVSTLLDLVVVDELGIRRLDPAPRRLVRLARKDAHGHRDRDAFGIPKATLVFPIEPRRRDSRVRQPKER